MSDLLLPSRRSRALPDPAVPLINLVFLLLAFFLIAGTLIQREPVPIELPSTPPLPGEERNYEAQIFISAEGQIYAASGEIFTDLPRLMTRLRNAGAQQLTIRADRRAAASVLLEAAQSAASSDFPSVRILTLREDVPPPQGQNR